MKKIILLSICLYLGLSAVYAQNLFNGYIYDTNGEPLIGATVRWEDSEIGAVTDIDGYFEIERPDTTQTHTVSVSYIGYQAMKIKIPPTQKDMMLSIEGLTQLEEVKIRAKKEAMGLSVLNPINTEVLGKEELRKAPCCNLAESFVTNPTVEVHYSDAVTGAKEVEMLGLRGTYTQLMMENRPTLQGLASAYGMEYIPGTWLQSIQISKGSSTVVNGYESITGQINVELQKPMNSDWAFINLYADRSGRLEANLHYNQKLSKRWSTGVLLHGNMINTENDHNKDGFLDVPRRRQLNGMSRWFYEGKTVEGQFNVQALTDERIGGQTLAHIDGQAHQNPYKIGIDTRRLDIFGKMGFIGFKKPFQSLGSIANATVHDIRSSFGNTVYNATQKSAYLNLIFETIIGNTFHKLRTGGSYRIDNYKELFQNNTYQRTESVPGVFGEYTYNTGLEPNEATRFVDKLTIMAGLRIDYHNLYKTFITPRMNLKYNFSEHTVWRMSAGRGYRVPNPFADNISAMASNRIFTISTGLKPEIAWNMGTNFLQKFDIQEHHGSINIDLYHTRFENQLVTDMFSDASKVLIYNLDGLSYSTNFVTTFTYELVKGLEMRLAYKFNDVKTTYEGKLTNRLLTARHRALANIYYAVPKSTWSFNFTAQYVGTQPLPAVDGSTDGLPEYRLKKQAPDYVLLHAQITKKFGKALELYIGGENLGNYTQKQPIIGENNVWNNQANQPRFDASAVFAPIMGQMIYGGLRYTLAQSPQFKAVEISTSAQCSMCKTRIEKAFEGVKGIQKANLDIETKKMKISYHKKEIDIAQLRAIILKLGYDADGVQGDQEAYQNLPACCKKQ